MVGDECYRESKTWQQVNNAGGWELRCSPTPYSPSALKPERATCPGDPGNRLFDGNWYKWEICIISGGLQSDTHPEAEAVSGTEGGRGVEVLPGPSSFLRPHSEGGAEVMRGTVEGQYSKLGLLYASLNII